MQKFGLVYEKKKKIITFLEFITRFSKLSVHGYPLASL